MSLLGMKAPVWHGGIQQWLSTVILSAVALVLTLVVLSLSMGLSLPGTSGDQEPLPEQNIESGTMNSSRASLVNRKMPEPFATEDTDTTTELDEKPSDPQRDAQGTCDLYHGEWFFDSSGPLYTNNSCPAITKTQNCQGNGWPDNGYENWRWKPEQCILPRFDARKFLELMRGKTIAFVGDSVARNQMESLLCILWQVDIPVNNSSPRMQNWIFRSTSTTIIRIWSSWLVHTSTEAVDFAPKGLDKVFLDIPDETFMEFLPSIDVLVLSSGHWYTRPSAYILNGNVVGGQRWWARQAGKIQMNC